MLLPYHLLCSFCSECPFLYRHGPKRHDFLVNSIPGLFPTDLSSTLNPEAWRSRRSPDTAKYSIVNTNHPWLRTTVLDVKSSVRRVWKLVWQNLDLIFFCYFTFIKVWEYIEEVEHSLWIMNDDVQIVSHSP